MGLISASSLGQPITNNNINKLNNLILNNSNVISKNKGISYVSNKFCKNIMAPALTTELSAEHRKRSLNNDLNIYPKLDSDNINSNRHLRQTNSTTEGGLINNHHHHHQENTKEHQLQDTNEDLTSFKTSTNTTTNNDDGGDRSFLRETDDVLDHNVDEILQVLESMEGGKCTSTAGEESMLQLLGSDLGGLLPDMDVTDHSQEQPPSPTPSPKVRAEERLGEVSGRQHLLERRCERLMRRVRKLQARGTAKHSAHQIQELATCARALLKARNASNRSHASTQATKEQLLDTEQVKNMSAAALVSLVKQISNTPQQGLAQALSPDQATSLRDGAGGMQFRLRHVESALDSDVTASSSGGDSCDEAVGFNPNHTGTAPIWKRAAWRYARERASVVGRWTWLQANISDLEYRIRQYSECHRHLRTNKGAVRLESTLKSTSQAEGGSTAQQLVVNGFHSSEVSVEPEDTETACRTRPLDLKTFKKRKLVVPGVLQPKSGKSYPPHNQPPCCRDANSMPCILCFSKRVAVASGAQMNREVTGREGCKERAARLDPALHPVLSGASDISRSLHMAAQLRQPGWQQTQLRQKGLARLGLGLKRTKAPAETPAPPRRKYTLHKKNNNNTANVLSAKIRRKAKSRKRHRGRPAQEPAGSDNIEKYKRTRRLQRNSMASSEGGPDGDYPVPSPSQINERQARRKRESSYDIDNIVIPYSMAALTRVEKLEYKEIPTPKWRVAEVLPLARKTISSKNGVVRGRSSSSAAVSESSDVDDTSIEDISEETVAKRHEPLEMEERTKFRCPPTNARGLRARRTDSRAESSGANTPDPMSPNPAGLDIGDSPLASPRATPPTVLPDDSSSSSNKLGGKTSSSHGGSKPVTGRRRTYQRPISPELPIEPTVPPFDARSFPLTDHEVQQMLAGMPPELLPPSETNTAPASPCGTDSTESAVPEEDEDPEWTLDCEPPDPPLPRTARK